MNMQGLNRAVVNGRYILQKIHMPGQAFNMYMAAWGLDDEAIMAIRENYPPMEVMVDDDGMLTIKSGDDEMSVMFGVPKNYTHPILDREQTIVATVLGPNRYTGSIGSYASS